MTGSSAVEKVAQNTLLAAVARVAMAISMPMLAWLVLTVLGHSESIATIRQRIDDGQRNRDAQYLALDRRFDSEDTQLVELTKAINELSKSVAGLEATNIHHP